MTPLPTYSKHLEMIYNSADDHTATYDYTVFRSVVTIGRRPRSVDFAVLWDETKDRRIIEIAERLFLFGMLADVRFLAVKGGTIHIYIHADTTSKETFEKRLRTYRVCERINADDRDDPSDGDSRTPIVHRTDACGRYRPKHHETESIGVKLTGIGYAHVLGVQDIEVVPPRPPRRVR